MCVQLCASFCVYVHMLNVFNTFDPTHVTSAVQSQDFPCLDWREIEVMNMLLVTARAATKNYYFHLCLSEPKVISTDCFFYPTNRAKLRIYEVGAIKTLTFLLSNWPKDHLIVRNAGNLFSFICGSCSHSTELCPLLVSVLSFCGTFFSAGQNLQHLEAEWPP